MRIYETSCAFAMRPCVCLPCTHEHGAHQQGGRGSRHHWIAHVQHRHQLLRSAHSQPGGGPTVELEKVPMMQCLQAVVPQVLA